MSETTSRKNKPRNRVLIAALVALAGVAGSVIGVALLNPKDEESTGVTVEDFGNAPTLGDTNRSEGLTIQHFADDGVTPVAVIKAQAVNPVDLTTKTIEQPVAWLYMDDGRFTLVEAEKGRFYQPVGQKRPESGRLEGNVRIRIFDPDASGDRPDPDTAPPLLTATMDRPLDFNFRLSEVTTRGRLEVRSEQLDFIGYDIRALLNEQRDRIDLLEVQRGEKIVYRPKTESVDAISPADEEEPVAGLSGTSEPGPRVRTVAYRQPAEAGVDEGGSPSDAPTHGSRDAGRADEPERSDKSDKPDHPLETRYRARFDDGIRVAQSSRSMTSDTLSVWLRLIDNKFPERGTGADETETQPERAAADVLPLRALMTSFALAMQGGEGERGAEIAGEAAGPEAARSDGVPETEAPALATGSEPVTLTWTGPLVVQALADDDVPEGLVRNDLALRATGQRGGPLRFADESQGVQGEASAFTYYDTTKQIGLESETAGVLITSTSSGSIRGVRDLKIDLASGSVAVMGEGELRTREHDELGDDGSRLRRFIRWSEGAEFLFAMADQEMTDQIRLASFTGRVLGANDLAEVTGSSLIADFVESESGNPAVRRVRISGANTTDGKGGAMRGDDMEVWFREDGNDSDLNPTRVIIDGNAEGRQADGSVFRARSLNASLTQDEHGDPVVSRVQAEGVTRLEDGKGTVASAEKLDARVLDEVAVFEGGAKVRRNTPGNADGLGGKATAIEGDRIVFNGKKNAASVSGPGMIAYSAEGTVFDAQWQKAMAFDDQSGTVTVVGDASGRLVSPDGSENTFRGERVDMTLVPADELPEGSEQNSQDRLRTAILRGVPGASGTSGTQREGRARIERRKYAPNASEVEGEATRVAEEIYFLEGDLVDLDNVEGVMTVPSPGIMLLADRRPAEGTPTRDDVVLGGSDDRGVSMIEWSGTMRARRADGLITADTDVRITHKRLADGMVATIEAELLTAHVDGLDTTEPGRARGELLDVRASGAVYAVIGLREVIADEVSYDAKNGILTAEAGGENLITVIDNEKGTTMHARGLRWEIATDRVVLDRPSPVVAPR